MSSLETLIAAGFAAETELQRQTALASQARAEYERRKLSAPAKEFSQLRDAADQADLRVQAAKCVCDEKNARLIACRDAERQRQWRIDAEKTYSEKNREVEQCHGTLLTQQREYNRLHDALAFGGQLFDRLLRERADLKSRLDATLTAVR